MKIFFITSIAVLFFSLHTTTVHATPFPIVGKIYNAQNELAAKANVYPRYVEIVNLDGRIIGKVGIMVEEGIAKLFLVREDNRRSLIGYSGPGDHPNKGVLYNIKDKLAGYYFWTPTWSFIYNIKNQRVGKVKCIAWPRVCAAGVGGYLLKLFDQSNAIDNQKK